MIFVALGQFDTMDRHFPEMFIILVLLLVGLVVLGLVEAHFHQRVLRRIPIRVHVNGTRGKSSVTRLIYAALRESGKVTCAKTTGTLARFITPQGKEYPIYRPAGANVGEQIRIVRTAATYAPDALVIECMALQPSYQWLSEKAFVQATHGVITNARPDHLDVMGPTARDVALALGGMTPQNGKLFTAERELLDVFEYTTADRGSELLGVSDADVAAVTKADMDGFSYHEHAENVALVLKVCADLGIDRETALKGMWKVPEDVGVLRAYPVDFFGRELLFINGFAANDPVSTGRIWNDMVSKHGTRYQTKIALFNCREDRPDRSFQLGEACVEWAEADHVLLIGSGVHAFTKAAFKGGLDSEKVHYADGRAASQIFEVLVSLAGPSAMIVGMGNIGGPGLELLRMVQNRASLDASVPLVPANPINAI